MPNPYKEPRLTHFQVSRQMQEIKNSSSAKLFLKRHPEKRWLLQFSFSGKKYYPINEKNVVRLPPYEPLCKKLNSIIAGNVETFEGYYCKATKSLAIIAA
jgi:hypothetical protein